MRYANKISSFFNILFVNFYHSKIVNKIEKVIEKMNYTERVIFFILSIICITTSLIMLLRVNDNFLVEVPSFGGEFTEGVIGSPRFINPIISISETDKDLVSIIYSGLMKKEFNSEIKEDLASHYSISEDGKIYDFYIREDVYFHDERAVTSDDVLFTISKILDPVIKSPKKNSWDGVLAEKIDNKHIRFTLEKPYISFLESLTIGIIPKHIWENASSEEFPFSELNIKPIGSGPYKIKKISRNRGGVPTSITLDSFNKYRGGRPKIKSITFKFFQNENDLIKSYFDNSIESIGNVNLKMANDFKLNENLILKTNLPRVFALFFNQNLAPIFIHKEIREALDIATPKKRIVDEVLYGFGMAIDGPMPTNTVELENGDIEKGKEILAKGGWQMGEGGFLEKKSTEGKVAFSFSITTSENPELKNTALILKEEWEKLGAKIDLKIFESSDLAQNIIRTRKYDALLFGEIIDEGGDLYPFWHSSQRVDPGLNISLYTNITVDKLLEEVQKSTTTSPITIENKNKIYTEIKKDLPAIFLFTPNFIYLKPEKVKNINLKKISNPSDRFVSISEWFIETDKVWKIFDNSKK